MINLSEKDKESIENTEGSFSARGVLDHLKVIEKRFGEEGKEKMQKEMRDLGYKVNFSRLKATQEVPTAFYIAFLIVEKRVFELDDEDVKEIGRDSAKISFLLRFASRLLVSVKKFYENADRAWKKYYKSSGEIRGVLIDEEQGKATIDLCNFVGHPIHCRYLEGYFAQLMFFVTGRDTDCKEEKCRLSDGGESHRFTVTWK